MIVWGFPDDDQNPDQMGCATEVEQQDIYETLWKWLVDWWETPVDDGD